MNKDNVCFIFVYPSQSSPYKRGSLLISKSINVRTEVLNEHNDCASICIYFSLSSLLFSVVASVFGCNYFFPIHKPDFRENSLGFQNEYLSLIPWTSLATNTTSFLRDVFKGSLLSVQRYFKVFLHVPQPQASSHFKAMAALDYETCQSYAASYNLECLILIRN